MLRFISRFLVLGIVCAGGAFAQGSFGQIAFGGCFVTTFTLVNMNSTTPANLTLSFYMDSGSPLSAPVQGAGTVTSYAFTIPANGAQDVVLTTTNATTVAGWAAVTATTVVRGQAVYRCAIAGRPTYEAVVPLSTLDATQCIIPFPPSASPVTLMPYDNTGGLHTTSLAFANITSSSISVPIEFDDQNNNKLATDTLTLGPLAHTAFDSSAGKYPAIVGTKGILRISAGTSTVTAIGFLFNPSGAFTTLFPITQ